MIRLREATMLALTKLRTRKVRLVVTVVISGLLFSILAGASITARGVFGSINDFSNEGFSNRYIASANPHTDGMFMLNEDLMDRAIAIHKEVVTAKKKEAKRLGIEYAESGEPVPVQEYAAPGGEKMRNLDPTHPAAKQAIREYQQNKPVAGLADLKRLAEPYKPTAYYESVHMTYDLQGGRIQVLKDGKESFEQNKQPKFGPPTGLDSFAGAWTLMSSELLKPFVLPGQSLTLGDDGSVPMVVPLSAAEQLLKLKALPASASSAERLERIKEIRKQAPNLTFAVCYRNGTSAGLVDKAVSVQQEIEQNKNKKDYRKPDLQYGLPTEGCGAAPVIRDVRTKDQKTQDTKQQQFDATFGAQPAVQQRFAFRVVGVVPDMEYGGAMNVTQIVRSLLSSSLGSGWFSPVELTPQDSPAGVLFTGDSSVGGASRTYYAEFSNAQQARTFIDKQNCTPDYAKFKPGTDPAQHCVAAGKPFGLGSYGSNSLGLESAKRTFVKIFSLAGLAVAFIASIIMMGTVGKMIADSRRETAVFRAIGAKKLDIAQIYLLYTLCISGLITAFAVFAGAIAAAWANGRWSAEFTQSAIVTYNIQDLDRVFRLYAFNAQDMLYLLGITVAAGLLSALFPLIRSLRRNPIRDMRDDT